MKRFCTRKRMAMTFSVLGITLMGIDLMMTRNFFTHIGELMAASIICFVIGIVLDRQPKPKAQKAQRPGHRKLARQPR